MWAQCVSAEPAFVAQTDKASVDKGESFVLTISADAERVEGLQMDIVYDADSLEYGSAEMSETLGSAMVSGIEVIQPGKVVLLAAFAEETDIDGSLCEISFKALGGDSEICVENILLRIGGEEMTAADLQATIKAEGGKTGGGGSLGGKNNSSSVKTDSEAEDKNEDKSEDEQEEITASKPEFFDISGHWAAEAIQAMLDQGIVSGVGDGRFAPDVTVTRAQMAVMLAKALNLENMAENSYTDIPDDAWYTDAVLMCTAEKLMLGSDNAFRPNDSVTREETAAILARAAEFIGIDLKHSGSQTAFADGAEVSDWAAESVAAMTESGFINGFEDETFRPKSGTTRAQMALLLKNILEGGRDL